MAETELASKAEARTPRPNELDRSPEELEHPGAASRELAGTLAQVFYGEFSYDSDLRIDAATCHLLRFRSLRMKNPQFHIKIVEDYFNHGAGVLGPQGPELRARRPSC